MAYFERTDEFDLEIACVACEQPVKERRYTAHLSGKCIGLKKLDDATKVRCSYDATHIIDADKKDHHLEFCSKHQQMLLERIQYMLRDGLP